ESGSSIPGPWPERRASRNSFHANARAANAIAVTEVVGVLVMVGAFLDRVTDAAIVREDVALAQSLRTPSAHFEHSFVAFAQRIGVHSLPGGVAPREVDVVVLPGVPVEHRVLVAQHPRLHQNILVAI